MTVTESLEMSPREATSANAIMEEADSPGSPDSASINTPDDENAQAKTQSLRNEHRENEKKGPICTEHPFKKHVLHSIITVALIGITSLATACWLIAYIQTRSKNERPYITAEIIGGRFSSTAAKLIDAAFSMLVAPAVIAIANWHMFKLARLSAVNEHRGRNSAVSMKVLVEVANTDWGSFSPLKFWTFARSKRPRVICLGAIADTYSLLPLDTDAASLYGQVLEPRVSDSLRERLDTLQPSMLGSAVDGLLEVNVSARSRTRLPSDVKKLFDAPVYRLNLSCHPSIAQAVMIERPDDLDPHVRIAFESTATTPELDSTRFQANFGTDASILSGKSLRDASVRHPGIQYPLIAFNQSAVWIGTINADQSSGINTPGRNNLVLAGMDCHLAKSNGRADVKVNGSQWTIIKDTLFNEQFDPRPNNPMSALTSALDFFDDGHVGAAPGLGGHLLRAALNITSEGNQPSWKLESLFGAFLWYETETRHILLDDSQAKKTGWYQIQCDTDRYAMTFIPWLLLTGLVALGIACGITVGLSIDSRKIHSLRIGRMLDSIRLTADVGVALDKRVFEECSTWHSSRLNKCADEARFQYEADTRLNGETGVYSVGIRLRQVSRPHE
ncbi:hypothetical protein LB507_007873 [Fusarium sp. FIESC RH6]|nr:hypothetical protein LB507_007873 [Fusarium sp. FIESC RH6]